MYNMAAVSGTSVALPCSGNFESVRKGEVKATPQCEDDMEIWRLSSLQEVNTKIISYERRTTSNFVVEREEKLFGSSRLKLD